MTKFYGLTGGIGSGKSTVAMMFNNLGVPILDLDQVGHTVLHEDKKVQQNLVQTFGQAILTNGHINRNKLAKSAFASTATTHLLNTIMHPAIQTYEQQWRTQQTKPFAIIEASVLIESNAVHRMDGLVVVLADLSHRQARVAQRKHYHATTFQQIIQRQCDDNTRQRCANFIIDNNKSKLLLEQQVHALYRTFQ